MRRATTSLWFRAGGGKGDAVTVPSAGARIRRALRRRQAGLASLVVVVAVVTLNLVQQPGLITFDTKLDLQFDAAAFLDRSLDVWNGDWAFGGLQNQASGYLVPMGPVFWLGEVLQVPMWIWERLWTAAVMLLAYFGTVRLARSWPGINAAGAVLAGLTYMLAPRVLITVGGLSGETLPSTVLPWTVLPLVLYLRGRLSAWVAFLWSAATIPWMGGQNATLVVACLVLPGLLLLLTAGRTWARRVRDAASWTGLALVACAWWIVPLLVMGAYSPPFLNFIESSANTATQSGWFASLRGTSHWVAFFPGGGTAGWVGGYELVASSVLVLTTAVVAGVGLLGLAQPTLWARRPLVVSMLVGMAVLTIGSDQPAGSVLGQDWLRVLDSSLAALRNVHKFDPIVRLPLSLGIGVFVTAGIPHLLAQIRRLPARGHALAGAGLMAALALLICAAAQPAASGELRAADGVEDISDPWQQAVTLLQEEPGATGVLVLPGSGFAIQTWGRTVDEPIQVLGSPPWSARSQSTVAPAGTMRVLDAIEAQVAGGRPITGLATTLSRLGITHVVVRNDLDPDVTNATPAAAVRASVTTSSGLDPVAEFGRTDEGYPAVEVLAVQSDGHDPRVAMTDWETREVVQGGPEVLNDLTQLGLVSSDDSVVLADGGSADDGPVDIATDSNQRVERSFARITDGVSGVMTAEDEYRLQRPVHDFAGGSVPGTTTDAEYEGAASITASSSGGYADVIGPIHPEEHPYAAFDGSQFTSWVTGPLAEPVGQWIEVGYAEPVDPGRVGLIFDNGSGADVSRVRLTTDTGSVEATVAVDGVAAGIDLPAGETRSVRMTVLDVRPGGARRIRLPNFAIDADQIRRTLRVPGEVGPDTTMLFRSELGRRACVSTAGRVTCSGAWQRETPETPGFDRTVDVSASATWRLEGRAVATNGASLERLFAPLSDDEVRVEASSTYAGDPAVVGANAFDGRSETSWYASPFDEAPTLQLSWKKPRTITAVAATLGVDQPGELPEALVVDPMDGSQPQLVATADGSAGTMSPVRTRQLRISVLPDAQRTTAVGIAELEIEGIDDLQHTVPPETPTGLVCGFGPTLEVGGQTVQTQVRGTIEDVVDGSELSLLPCDDEGVHIAAGTQRIRVTNPGGFAISRLWLEPAGEERADTPGRSDADVVSWSPTERTIEVTTQPEALLSLAQSDNAGWEARIDGTLLDPVAIDGWKQGWRVPAGTTGTVTLEFRPQRSFEVGLAVGLGLAAVLNVAALVTFLLSRGRPSQRRRGARVAPASSQPVDERRPAGAGTNRAVLLVGAAAMAVVSFPLAIGALAGFTSRRMPLLALSAICASGVVVAAAMPVVDAGGPVHPPVAADVITAVVVGLVSGRVLFGEDDAEAETA